jgi:hypothetical protein
MPKANLSVLIPELVFRPQLHLLKMHMAAEQKDGT